MSHRKPARRLWARAVRRRLAVWREYPLYARTDCPYFRGVGTCSYGCYSEPGCMTDHPEPDNPHSKPYFDFFGVPALPTYREANG